MTKRTLTALYNERPAWLANLRAALEQAVWAAYEWEGEPGETSDEEVLRLLLLINESRR